MKSATMRAYKMSIINIQLYILKYHPSKLEKHYNGIKKKKGKNYRDRRVPY